MCRGQHILVAMQLRNEDIDEFINLYEKEFGERISNEQAGEIASNFASLYAFLAEPLPSEQVMPKVQNSPETDARTPL